MNDIKKREDYLYDVAILRPLAIIMLVMHHAFIPYSHGWSLPEGFEENNTYCLISAVTISFMLELFVFISGYVFAFSLKKHDTSFSYIIKSRFKRLIIPLFVLGGSYLFIFSDCSNVDFFKLLYGILEGPGHLWFLPMLFWCTLWAFLINRLKIKQAYKIVLIFILPILSIYELPFQIGKSFYFLFFFYSGIIYYNNNDLISHKCNLLNNSVLMGGGISLLYVSHKLTLMGNLCLGVDVPAFISEQLNLYIKLAATMMIVLSLFFYANYYIKMRGINGLGKIADFNQYCFGIYLFQQFILMFIYYKTNIPVMIGSTLLPWFGFITTFIGAYILAFFLRKNKYCRKII